MLRLPETGSEKSTLLFMLKENNFLIVVFHSSPQGLFDYFPRSVLPTEYGGTLQDNATEDWMKTANKFHEEYTIEGQPNFY
ncbi:hypothetical protein AVEN_106647-1 [Araneus ventricosus]|uniref:CRAL-TRIO domain-containing protein n=1 Tax=Araneus ventricosus TaxID=182803 RepID=A0A4Y2QVR6_ARAVE|nr:hypothetical protein AVEN_106647-1 [Araneus ventricosus]